MSLAIFPATPAQLCDLKKNPDQKKHCIYRDSCVTSLSPSSCFFTSFLSFQELFSRGTLLFRVSFYPLSVSFEYNIFVSFLVLLFSFTQVVLTWIQIQQKNEYFVLMCRKWQPVHLCLNLVIRVTLSKQQ